MNRALRVVSGLVTGFFYGCVVGLFVYVAAFVFLGAMLKSASAQSVSFELGLLCVPLLMALKAWQGRAA